MVGYLRADEVYAKSRDADSDGEVAMIKDLWLVLTGKLSSQRFEDAQLQVFNCKAHCDHLIQQRIEPISIAVGRLLAKTDPNYFIDELDPSRRAASDDIGRKAMARIMAEAAARRKGRE